ncbi:MAG: RNA polymerase sigma factor [Pirellulales bacterium]
MGRTEQQIAGFKQKANRLLAAARVAPDGQIAELLELYRPYLLAIANKELDPALRGKAGASDMVQETLWRATKVLADQQLPDDASALRELLRKTLIRRLDALRQQYRRTAKRQIRRERSLDDDEVQELLKNHATAPGDTPGSRAAKKERRARTEQALGQLSVGYRQIIIWHNRDGLSWQEIAKKLDRSPDAVRMLWKRAVNRLKQSLETGDQS